MAAGSYLDVLLEELVGIQSHFEIELKSSPKTITLTGTDKVEPRTLGIYRIDGDTMKIAVFSDKKKANERPQDFEPGKGRTVATYRKRK